MKRHFIYAAFAASFIFGGSGAALAVPAATTLACTPGSVESTVVSYTHGDNFNGIHVSTSDGASIGFYATLTDTSATGSLQISGGSTILDFPNTLSKVISTPLDNFLMLNVSAGTVTVSIVCNPGSGTAATIGRLGGDLSSVSLTQTRQATRSNLMALMNQLGIYTDALARMDEAQRARYVNLALGQRYWHLYALREQYRVGSTLYNWLGDNLQDLYDEYMEVVELSSEFAYQPGEVTAAVEAIDDSFGRSSVVENTFNVLGYGPNAGFEGNAVLGQGDDWLVTASATGAISQTDLGSGNTGRSLSGRGTLNLVTMLSPDLVAGVGVSLGATSEDTPTLDDQAYHYGADLMLQQQLAPNLTMTGGVGYELTSHNFTQGTGTGSALGHLFRAQVGVTGNMGVHTFIVKPSLDVELTRETLDGVTLSDGTVLAAVDRLSGTATAGAKVSQIHLVETATSTILVEPFVGIDTSLSLYQRQSGGTSSANAGLGVGLSGGVSMTMEDGLAVSLSSRLSRSADTLGGSVTGKLSAAF